MERIDDHQSVSPLRWAIPLAAISTVVGSIALLSLFGPYGVRLMDVGSAVPAFLFTLLSGPIAFSAIATHLRKQKEAPGEGAIQEEVDDAPIDIQSLDDQQLHVKLEHYLKQHPVGPLEADHVLDYAKQGQTLVEAMLEGKSVTRNKMRAVKVIWYLTVMQLAKEGRGYDSWMWKIKDPHGKLTEFFQNLPGVYERRSTHYKGRTQKKQYGYDFGRGILPSGKATVLITPLDSTKYKLKEGQQLLGLKLEVYGTNTPSDKFMHSIDYLKSLVRKVNGGNDKASMRKEHLPKALKQYGKKRICELVDVPEAQDDISGYDHKNTRDGHEVSMGRKDLMLSQKKR